MNEYEFYHRLLLVELALCPIILIALLKIAAPYGRYASKTWGPQVNAKLGWIAMEAAALLSFDLTYIVGERPLNGVALVFFCLWNLHYIDRAIVYPWRLPASARKSPLAVFLMGLLFNIGNGYANARFLSAFGPAYTAEWMLQAPFVIGLVLFVGGFLLNRYADNALLKLRTMGDSGYKVPQGMLFKYVSCPNYLGEIIQWFGWAIATWSLPGLVFAIFTASNLIPRAYTHHCWYRAMFPDYPADRKAIIPLVF